MAWCAFLLLVMWVLSDPIAITSGLILAIWYGLPFVAVIFLIAAVINLHSAVK